MASFEFTAIHSDRWSTMLPKLTAAGKEGYHVVGFLSEGGCYSALMERGQQWNERGLVEDQMTVRISPVAVGPREQVYHPQRREEDDLENDEGA